jgi:predicted dehydrogenase
MTLRVGIMSANWGAFAHLPAWRSIPGVEVVAICTSRRETAEAAAKRSGIATPFWDAQAMGAHPELDILDCGTRPSVRDPVVANALRHRKHVYNAIPFATNIGSARELRDAWRASGKVGVVDAFCEWLPAHRLVKEMLEGGYLGQPFGGTCLFQISLFNKPNTRFPYNWFWQSGLGVSALRNLGSHALHMLVYLFGDIEEVVAHDGQLLREWHFEDGSTIKPQTNDFASLLLRFRTGLVMQLQVSWSATVAPGWSLEAFGSKGRFAVTAPNFPTSRDSVLRAGTLAGGQMEKIEIPERLLRSADVGVDFAADPAPVYPMALSMNRMVQSIRGVGSARPDFEQAWVVECVLEAARRSAEERRWVHVEEVLSGV